MKQGWKKRAHQLALILGLLLAVWFTTLFWIKVGIIASAYLPQKTTSKKLVAVEEYDVYSAIIKTKITRFNTEVILIENTTGPADALNYLSPNNPWSSKISDELWNNYYSQNQQIFELSKSFSLNKPYIVVEQNKMQNLNRLLLITHTNSTPFLQFSRVGFNNEENKAFVQVGKLSLGDTILGYMGFAHGNYYYLEKINSQWIIKDEWESFTT